MRLVELEQTIISGVNESGVTVNEAAIGKGIMKILRVLKRPEDILRLLAIYMVCYALPDSDYKTCLKIVTSQEEREVLKAVSAYAGREKVKKITRRVPVIS